MDYELAEDKDEEIITFTKMKLTITYGSSNSMWRRMYEIIRWIFTGKAEFDL